MLATSGSSVDTSGLATEATASEFLSESNNFYSAMGDAIGTTADAAEAGTTAVNGTVIRFIKGVYNRLVAIVTSTANIATVLGTTTDTTSTDSPVAGSVTISSLLRGIWDKMWLLASAFGGLSPFKLISAATTNATVIKSSSGRVATITAICTGSTVRYLKLYNKATAPTVGTDVPVLTIPIPAATAGAGFSITFPNGGLSFATGIGCALTTGSADNDTNAVAAGEIIIAASFY
jgi:hypothetical protein